MATPAQQILPPPPQTLPPWAKVLYFLADTALTGAAWMAYDYASSIQPVGGSVEDPPAGSWRKFVYHYSNIATTDAADDQSMSFDVANVTAGELDSTWNTADYTAVATELVKIVNAIAPFQPQWLVCDKLNVYVRSYLPYQTTVTPQPIHPAFAESGPPDYVTSLNIPGTSNAGSVPQGTTTLTEMTADRSHWGRVYLPTISSSTVLAATGRLGTAFMDVLMDAAESAFVGLSNAQFPVVVPSVQANKTPARVLQTVSGIRCDDVIDVHRHRRYKHPTVRDIRPVP